MQQFSCRYVFQVGRDLPAVHRADRGPRVTGVYPRNRQNLTPPPPRLPTCPSFRSGKVSNASGPFDFAPPALVRGDNLHGSTIMLPLPLREQR